MESPKPTPPTTTPEPETERKPSEPWVEIAQDEEGWHWQWWAGNGRPVARNAIPYETRKHCLQAIKLIPGIVAATKVVLAAER